jgi:hypothetical protein
MLTGPDKEMLKNMTNEELTAHLNIFRLTGGSTSKIVYVYVRNSSLVTDHDHAHEFDISSITYQLVATLTSPLMGLLPYIPLKDETSALDELANTHYLDKGGKWVMSTETQQGSSKAECTSQTNTHRPPMGWSSKDACVKYHSQQLNDDNILQQIDAISRLQTSGWWGY